MGTAYAQANLAGSAAVELRSSLVVSSATPVLDAAVVRVAGESNDSVLLLHPDAVELLSGPEGSAQPALRTVSRSAIPLFRIAVRDQRGRLAIRQWPRFDVYLPGRSCNGNFSPQLELKCEENNDPWPLGSTLLDADDLEARFPFTRNFFSGEVSGRRDSYKLPPFFSAAHWRVTGKEQAPASNAETDFWLLATVDGRIYRTTGSEIKEVAVTGWGSDITSVLSHCGAGRQLLVTSVTDRSQEDRVQAVELSGESFHSIAPTVTMAGPVLSLWPNAVGQAAIAVVHNLKNGAYEVYRLEVACDR